MSTSLSVAQVLANLEKKLAFHRDQEALHIQQEAFHREQRAVHSAEIEKVAQHLEAFKAVALPAAELAMPPTPPPLPEEPDLGVKPLISRLVTRVVASRPVNETFGSTQVAAEVNQRYAAQLRRPVNPRTVSVTLRRMRDTGQIHDVQEGRAHHEAIYAKGPRPAGGR
jgi:regulator of protease activity HflC (stomatin/prohibitin superfamily)